MKTVTVIVEGGVVQHVDVPEGVEVTIHDYDVEDDGPNVLQDAEGNRYFVATWAHE